jgi:zinc transporter ZupT
LNLTSETIFLAFGMALFCALPLVSEKVRKHSKTLFLIGTGAMLGICVFDLVPDIVEMGGRSSLWVSGAVWMGYSLLHVFHIGHHHHVAGEPGEKEQGGSLLFLFSMVGHCFASGMLLAVSQVLSPEIANTVFFALLAHKGYESLSVSSVLIEQKQPLRNRLGTIALYALSLPAGVLATVLFKDQLGRSVAILISSIAVGTLLGCLLFDFLLPSLAELRRQRHRFGWVVLGLVVTEMMMRSL